MSVATVTGSAGLAGSESCRRYHEEGFEGLDVVGLDNDMRAEFFDRKASTLASQRQLEEALFRYRHFDLDSRDGEGYRRSLHALAGGSK